MPGTEGNPDELKNLLKNCKYEWGEIGGVVGSKFAATNGNAIFFPAMGRIQNGATPTAVSEKGFYWAGTGNYTYPDRAYVLILDEDEYLTMVLANTRCDGLTVRPMAK